MLDIGLQPVGLSKMTESSGLIERAAALAPLVGHIVFTVEAHPTQEVKAKQASYAQRPALGLAFS
jgi:hypothetical protein